MTESPGDPRRLRRRLVLLLLIAVGSFAAASFLQSQATVDDPRRIAADFLAAHAEVRAQVGSVARVEDVASQKVSAGPEEGIAHFDLLVVGRRGAVRAEVEMKKGPQGRWHVQAATLYTQEGPVPLIEPATCATCSKV